MPRPNLIISGCQKCGTTWLHASLSKSTQIFGSQVKELNHFNKPDYQDRTEKYLLNFIETAGVSYYMESTPHYFQLAQGRVDTASNIRAALDNPRIIVIFRNPIMRYESAYIHHMMMGRIPYSETINELSNEQKLLSLGHYASILDHWLGVFPDLGVFFYDDIVASGVTFVDSVMSFLELENDISPDSLDFRTNDKQQKILKLDKAWPKMPRMTEDLQARLAAYYSEEINRLQDLTGRDLQNWLFLSRNNADSAPARE